MEKYTVTFHEQQDLSISIYLQTLPTATVISIPEIEWSTMIGHAISYHEVFTLLNNSLVKTSLGALAEEAARKILLSLMIQGRTGLVQAVPK
ncbi:YueH family protein [Brevibacillus dissolubilis]|uniref:YueH family protein n=1 Tax=Brevibacillus dissolubilis TaxID=1844116 RepID=UPI001116855F|nr:YueH family protein [Brevibacillus dissolubilis]